jgi:hypothetical protein
MPKQQTKRASAPRRRSKPPSPEWQKCLAWLDEARAADLQQYGADEAAKRYEHRRQYLMRNPTMRRGDKNPFFAQGRWWL